MKTLNFAGKDYYPTLTKRKCATIRFYDPEKHDFTDSEGVRGVFNDVNGKEPKIIYLLVTSVPEVKLLKELTDAEAQEGGFHDAACAARGLRAYYGDRLTPDARIVLIRYVLGQDALLGLDYAAATATFANHMLTELKANKVTGHWLDGCDEDTIRNLSSLHMEKTREFQTAVRSLRFVHEDAEKRGRTAGMSAQLAWRRTKVRELGADLGNLTMMMLDVQGALR